MCNFQLYISMWKARNPPRDCAAEKSTPRHFIGHLGDLIDCNLFLDGD